MGQNYNEFLLIQGLSAFRFLYMNAGFLIGLVMFHLESESIDSCLGISIYFLIEQGVEIL